jgi:hypothetical protein
VAKDELMMVGWQLRDATLEDVAHYFIYNADVMADWYLR